MATIFKPRRTNQDKANQDTNTVLSNGEMLISFRNATTSISNTNINNRHNIYFGDGSTILKNLGPSIYGDTSIEPVLSIPDIGNEFNTTTKCLNYITTTKTFGQCISALKKAIQLSQQEQDNWYTAPINQTPDWFVNNFDSNGAQSTGYRNITIKTESGTKYLDLSNIVDEYTELYIKATIIKDSTEIVMPITIPKNRLYPLSSGYQSFRTGYQINSANGAMVAFKIVRERVMFDQAWINGVQCGPGNDQPKLRWAFSWKWRESVPTPG